jgi:hypothetical protein
MDTISDKTTEMQHTPGRWHINVHNAGQYYGDLTSDLPQKIGNIGCIRTIAVVLKYAPKSEQAANARLIAAAPDLLEALQGMLKWYDHGNDQQRIKEFSFALAKARDAVTKATGV